MQKEEMTLNEYLDGLMKTDSLVILKTSGLFQKVLDLESLDRYFQTMLGVSLEINVKPIEKPGGRWWGKDITEVLTK